MAALSFDVQRIPVEDIFVVRERRPLDDEAVARLAQSIKAIDLRTPITVRVEDVTDPESGEVFTAYGLITGHHRLAAFQQLGLDTIPAIVRDCDLVEAELWEIAENLHRSDLTKEQRDEQIRRYAELLSQRGAISVQNEPKPKVGRPAGVASQVANETGLSKSTVNRALNPERAQAERARSKIDADVKERAAKEVAEIIAEYVPGEWWDAVKANLYAAGASNIANELTNATGQSIMDRRHA